MTVPTYNHVPCTSCVTSCAAGVYELKSFSIDRSCRVAGKFASDECGLAETLLCFRGQNLLIVAWHGHLINESVCMPEFMTYSSDTCCTFCGRSCRAGFLFFEYVCGQLVSDRRGNFKVWLLVEKFGECIWMCASQKTIYYNDITYRSNVFAVNPHAAPCWC